MKEQIREALYQISPGVLAFVLDTRYRVRIHRTRRQAIRRPTDPHRVDVLSDPLFLSIIDRVMEGTAYETARIAQVFLQSRESVDGVMIDVGTHRGGVALMLSLMHPDRQVYACDTFKGIQGLPRDSILDAHADTAPPWSSSVERVRQRLRGTRALVVEGVFPHSIENLHIEDISFAHIDVVLGTSCRDTLEYLVGRATPRARFFVNDFGRESPGIDKAVRDFVGNHPHWMMSPIYPGQCVLVNCEGAHA